MNKRWSVVVVAKGMWKEVTQRFIETLLETDEGLVGEIIYVENGSPDKDSWHDASSFFAERFITAKMIWLDKELTLSGAWNTGARVASYQRLLFCNNDLWFTDSGWLSEFDSVLDDEKVGIVGITGMSWMNTPFIQGSLFGVREENLVTGVHGIQNDRRSLFVTEYGFDERFLFTCEDVDFSKRLQMDGLSIKSLEHLRGTKVHHAEGATRNFYRDDTIDYQRRAHLSRIEFCYKWTYPLVQITD